MSHASKYKILIGLIEPICADMGLELVELEQSSNPKGAVLRVYIDRLAGAPQPDVQNQNSDVTDGSSPEHVSIVQLKECEQVSRQISAVLDVEEPISYAYSLEVSSPGLDRPLRKPEHFNRFKGEEVKVALHQMKNGRRKYDGKILGANDETVEIEFEGETVSFDLDGIASARLVPDWDAIMGKVKKSKKNAKNSKKTAQKKTQPESNTQFNNQETNNPKGALMA